MIGVVKLFPELKTSEDEFIQSTVFAGFVFDVLKVTSEGPQVVSEGTFTLSVMGHVAGQLTKKVANT